MSSEFWVEFFKGPLELSLNEIGSSIEELLLYAIIHHDHHFFIQWASGSFSRSLDFDNIRDTLENRFHHLFEWVNLNKRTDSEWRAVMRMIIFTGNRGAHQNVFKLLGIEEVWT